MTVRQIDDRDLLSAFLSTDRAACAYQIGDLDDSYFPWCTWWGAFDEQDQLRFVYLHYIGLSIPVALTFGDPDYLPGLLDADRDGFVDR